MRSWKLAAIGLIASLLGACVTPADIQPMPPIPPELVQQVHDQSTSGCVGAQAGPTAADYWRAYPARALDAGVQGWVVLRVVVAPDGTLTSVDAVQGAPAGVFENAATGIVSRLTFPVHDSECTKLMLIQFRLAG